MSASIRNFFLLLTSWVVAYLSNLEILYMLQKLKHHIVKAGRRHNNDCKF